MLNPTGTSTGAARTARLGDDDRMQPHHSAAGTTVLAGVDAGATKAVALAVTPDGSRLGRADGEGANPKRHGLAEAADRIAALVLQAAGEVPALLAVAGAGIDRPVHARALEEALAERLPGTRILVANDTLAVLRLGAPAGVGLVVPVSTGGNVIGRASDGRVTDRGHGIFGGGYVLGALAARAARRGGGRVDAQLAAAVAEAGIAWRGRRPGPEAARLGLDVVAAAERGDPWPARLVDRWCRRVTGAVHEEVARLDLGESPVVIVYGGLLEASPWLGGRIDAAIRSGAPGARIGRLAGEPVEGAALLARDAWAGEPVAWDFTPRR